MHERTANLLGTTALAVSDLLLTGATRAASVSASGAAALVMLSHAPGISVTELGRRIGLSQPAAARMVDSLEAQGLVERRPTLGRWVAVHPTTDGDRTAGQILGGRAEPLVSLVGRLDDADRTQLDELLSKLLTYVYEDVGDNELLCRLCDRIACTSDQHTCPVGEASRNDGRTADGAPARG